MNIPVDDILDRLNRPIPERLSLIVRCLNIGADTGWPFSDRASGIADKLFDSDSTNIGVIGLQEVSTSANCPDSVSRLDCLDRKLTSKFGRTVHNLRGYRYQTIFGKSVRIPNELGVLSDSDWQIVSNAGWRIGGDNYWKSWPKGQGRFLLEATLRHVSRGFLVRFYTTHLSADPNNTIFGEYESTSERLEQTGTLIHIIRGRQIPATLPSILVGDFNENENESVHAQLAQHFDFVHISGVDMIWTGRKSSFPESYGSFSVSGTPSIIQMTPNLTDTHNCPSVRLTISLP